MDTEFKRMVEVFRVVEEPYPSSTCSTGRMPSQILMSYGLLGAYVCVGPYKMGDLRRITGA